MKRGTAAEPPPPPANAPDAAPTPPAQAVAPVCDPATPVAAARFAKSYYRHDDGSVRRNLSAKEMADAVASGGGVLWVDVNTSERHSCAVLDKVFNFHPLSVEDALNPKSRVKLEEYPGYLFMIVRGVKFCDDTQDDPYDIETYNIAFFLGKRFLVTVHGQDSRAIDELELRIDRNPELLGRGVERMLHAITDASVDAYFPIVDQIDEFVDGLEERVFVNFDQAALRDIFSVKRLVLSLRRHLSPQREVFNVLTNRPTAFLTPETQVYFRDVYDHLLRINESLDTYRELLSSTLDSYLSQVSNRLGQVTKGLSVVATLSVPFVVVSGMWGMNFSHIPLSSNPHGFAIMMVFQLLFGIALVALLKWREWL